jgi:hypothetical protein
MAKPVLPGLKQRCRLPFGLSIQILLSVAGLNAASADQCTDLVAEYNRSNSEAKRVGNKLDTVEGCSDTYRSLTEQFANHTRQKLRIAQQLEAGCRGRHTDGNSVAELQSVLAGLAANSKELHAVCADIARDKADLKRLEATPVVPPPPVPAVPGRPDAAAAAPSCGSGITDKDHPTSSANCPEKKPAKDEPAKTSSPGPPATPSGPSLQEELELIRKLAEQLPPPRPKGASVAGGTAKAIEEQNLAVRRYNAFLKSNPSAYEKMRFIQQNLLPHCGWREACKSFEEAAAKLKQEAMQTARQNAVAQVSQGKGATSCSTITDKDHPSSGPCRQAQSTLDAARSAKKANPSVAQDRYREAAETFRRIGDFAMAVNALIEGGLPATALGPNPNAPVAPSTRGLLESYDPGPEFDKYPVTKSGLVECAGPLNDELPGSLFNSGPVKYVCQLTRLSHLTKSGADQIRKFIGIACALGDTEQLAKFNASARATDLVYRLEIAEADELGAEGSRNEIFVPDHSLYHCVRADGRPSHEHQFAELPFPPFGDKPSASPSGPNSPSPDGPPAPSGDGPADQKCGRIIAGASMTLYQGRFGSAGGDGYCHARTGNESNTTMPVNSQAACQRQTGDLFVEFAADHGKNFNDCVFKAPSTL